MRRAIVAMAVLFAMSAAVLSGCGGDGESDLTAGDISGEELSLMMPGDYLSHVSDFAEPDADILEESGFWSNEAVIEDSFDPKDTQEALGRFGRLTGYSQVHTDWGHLLEAKGTVLVDLGLELFAGPRGASDYLAYSLTDAQEHVGQRQGDTTLEELETFTPDGIADESIGLRQRLTTPPNGAEELYATVISFRRGRVVAHAAILRTDDKDIVEEVAALGRALDEGIQAVLRGDVTPTAAATP